MNTTKFLASSVSALAIVGSIGIAYAQTSPSSATQPTDSALNNPNASTLNSQTPSTPAATTGTMGTTGTTGSSGTMNNTPTDSSMGTERPAQADRN